MRRWMLGDPWGGAENTVQTGWVEIAVTLGIALLVVLWVLL